MANDPRASVRPATMADLAAIGHVSHQTGLLGEPIDRFFPDESLWTDALVRGYLETGCCNYVAAPAGEVSAYVIGSCDHRGFLRWLGRRLPGVIGSGLLRGRYPHFLRDLPYLWRAWRSHGQEAPWDRYPAELHINALPAARGLGLGSALLARFLECLRRRGLAGVQLGTTVRNEAALRLYEKFGFRVYARWRSDFWKPYVGEAVEHLRLVRELP